MTEQNNSSVPEEKITSAVETPPQPMQEPSRKEKRTGPVLGAIAIVLVIALGAGGAYYQQLQQQQQQQQLKAQSAENQALRSQLDALKQNWQQSKQQLDNVLQQQGSVQQSVTQQQASVSRQLQELQARVVTLSGKDAKTWLLAQADFLVKQAGRKLWNDQDVTTAAALLKSADASLADMNDPSLIEVRRALTEDIGSLAAVAQIDFDGIILKVNHLSNQIDNLRLADTDSDDSPMDVADGSGELSASLTEWRQNLKKSWNNFMADFITIKRRDSAAEPLLAPNQDVYLRENIRSRLLIAAQAVPRHQNEVYKQSLEAVSTWVRAYFDATDPATKAFLAELETLRQSSVALDIPTKLKSQALVESVMQTRVRNLLAQPAASSNKEG